MEGERGLLGTLSTRPLSGNALEVSQAAIVPDTSPGGLKLIPVVVNVTSAFAVVHAAVPWLQVLRARLAAVAAVLLPAIAFVVTQPKPVIKSA
jgi:hypothetical protein